MSDENEYRLQYFGQPWNVPMLEDAQRVDTPVGDECLHCEEPIRLGEQGVIRPYYSTLGVVPTAIHRECDLRMILGGVRHLNGGCSCHGGSADPDPPNVSRRDAARMVYAWSLEHGGAR